MTEVLRIGEHEFRPVGDPVLGVGNRFEVPLAHLGELRLSDLPNMTQIDVVFAPNRIGEYKLDIRISDGPVQWRPAVVVAMVSFPYPADGDRAEIDSRLLPIRRAFLSLVERGLASDPVVLSAPSGDARTTWAARFHMTYRIDEDVTASELAYRAIHAFSALNERRPRVFICHASEDRGVADRLVAFIDRTGAHAWIDRREIRAGDSIVQKIDDGLGGATHVAVLLSSTSVSKPWVMRELSSATSRMVVDPSVRLIPVLLDDCSIPAMLHDLRFADCRSDEAAGFTEVLARCTGREPASWSLQVLSFIQCGSTPVSAEPLDGRMTSDEKRTVFNRYPHMPKENTRMKVPRISAEEARRLIHGKSCVNEVELIQPGMNMNYWVREYRDPKTGETVFVGGDFSQLEGHRS
jgi:hypothetical protein